MPSVNIIVCIKQVLNTYSDTMNNQKQLERDKYELINNPNDLNAIEEALKIKEMTGGTVTCISMAPKNSLNNLRDILNLGVDKVILLSDARFAGSDTLATSYILSAAIQKIGKYDLILLGSQSLDGETGQVGPSIAGQLNIPHVTNISKIHIDNTKTKEAVIVESDNEDNKVRLKIDLPVLLCVKKHMNEVRIPSVLSRMKAASAKIWVWTKDGIDIDFGRIGQAGSPTQVINLYEYPNTVKNRESTKIFLFEQDRSCISYISSKIRTV